MGMADTVTKEYMRGNKVFADAFNYLIYGGKAVVDPAQLRELDTTEIVLPFGAKDENGSRLRWMKTKIQLKMLFRNIETC